MQQRFISVTWHLHRFLSNFRPHTKPPLLQWTHNIPIIVLTIIFPSPLVVPAEIILISVSISRFQSAKVMSLSVLSFPFLLALHLIVKRWLWSFSSVRSSLLPIHHLFLSGNSWPLLLRIFLSIPGSLRENRRPLLLVFVLLFSRR